MPERGPTERNTTMIPVLHVNHQEAVTLRQVAEMLGTSVGALHAQRSRGRIELEPLTKLGTEHLFSKAQVERLARLKGRS